MTLVAVVVLVVAITTMFTLFVRAKDIPPPEPVSPTQYLEDRKAAIYENLRDLQFEYRVGKLSDADYQQTKLTLQKELASVLATIDRVTNAPNRHTQPVPPAPKVAPLASKAPPAPLADKARETPLASARETPLASDRQTPLASDRETPLASKAAAAKAFEKRVPVGLQVCPHCGAEFPKPMKFCGECGKAMA